jgi:16S rRNA (guanine1207-N2)-methyltransferase
MTRDALKPLFHPFASGELDVPSPDAQVLFLGAEPGFVLPDGLSQDLHLVQGFRPDFLALQKVGYVVSSTVPDGPFDAALVLAGRHRGQNELRVADALERVVPGGLILVAGSKDEGVASLRKRLAELVSIEGQSPKFHGLAVWFRHPADAPAIAAILRAENPSLLVAGGFRTAPGMFSHDRVDAGSQLLADCLPPDLSGRLADFCAGWGYLAVTAAERCPGIKSFDLYEADFDSLEAAKANLADLSVPVRFFWHDLLSEPVAERYDAVLMNPPFHKGRAGEPSIGQGMIKTAAASLRKGGRLFMVANRHLPYEETLAQTFSSHARIADQGGFKAIVAVR